MSLCHLCEGPCIKCEVCHHRHCDDEACPAYPIQCAEEAQQ